MSLKKFALQYVNEKLAIFPVNLTDDNKKIPLTEHGFKDASTDPAKALKWFSNGTANGIGMATGTISRRVVLDIDVKGGKKGLQSLEAIKAEYKTKTGKNFPKTKTARSHTGGIHLHFVTDQSYPCLANIREGVDFRGDGGFIVMPGSKSTIGLYSWDMATYEFEYALFPSDLWSILNPPKEKFEPPTVASIGSRTDNMKKMVASMRSYDFDPLMMESILTAYVANMESPPNDPAPSPAQIRAIIAWSMKLAPTAVSKQIANIQLQGAKSTFSAQGEPKITSHDTLPPLLDLARNSPDQTWLIDSIWTDKSRGFIAGNPGIGKTWLAIEMALSVTSGHPFLDVYPIPQPMPTLIIEEETSRISMGKRLTLLINGKDYTADEFARLEQVYFLVRKALRFPDNTQEIIDFVKEHNIRFVILDSLRRFHTADENSSKDMQPVLDSMAAIGDQTGASVCAIHHLHKSGKENMPRSVFERLRGTSDLWAWRDCVLGIEQDGLTQSEAKVSFQFREAEATPPFLVVREHMGDKITLTLSRLEETQKFVDMAFSIKEKMNELGPALKTVIVDGVTGKRIFKFEVFEWMIKSGQVRQDGRLFLSVGTSSQNDGNLLGT